MFIYNNFSPAIAISHFFYFSRLCRNRVRILKHVGFHFVSYYVLFFTGVKKDGHEISYLVKFLYEEEPKILSSRVLRENWPIQLTAHLEASIMWEKNSIQVDHAEIHLEDVIGAPERVVCK